MLSIIFPRPSVMEHDEYAKLSKYFAYVNLIKPSVNRIVSGVCSSVSRRIEDSSPYKEEVDEFLSPVNGYSNLAREWFKSGVLYGTGIMGFVVHEGDVRPWLPNPLNTKILTGFDVRDLEAIIEKVSDNEFRIATKSFWAIADRNGHILSITEHGLGICPAVICYGEDERIYGKVEGRSAVENAAQYSAVISLLLLQLVELIRTYSDPKGILSGTILNESEALEKNGIMHLDSGGTYRYESPDANFDGILRTIESYKVNYCISSSIPMDTLDPAATPDNQSATSARLRNQPLAVTINRFIEEQSINEARALTIVGALYQWLDTGSPVTFKDFSKRFKATITMLPSASPESQTDEVNSWERLIQMGAKEVSDAIRHFNRTASEIEISERIARFETLREKLVAVQNQIESSSGEMPDNNKQPGETPGREVTNVG